MRINYEQEDDILMIETGLAGTIDHAEHTGSFISHFSEDGQLLLLEILDASEFLSTLVKVTARGQAEEIPLVAV
jgi:hypothetical protein